MATVCYRALRGAACLAVLALAACAQQGQDEMSWARAALVTAVSRSRPPAAGAGAADALML